MSSAEESPAVTGTTSEEEEEKGGVPLPNVKAPAMSRVLEYLNMKHSAAAEEARAFEKAFFERTK
ncbi:hypothetical protein C2845_PM06G22740 [Panicum miliaceum]|uniref:Uncharacterized protein n=1 Tax=Panicum miliaceum TaxID=4540 RepID=A0A3L6RGW3_PANMI|nr:hypothetical protein C2845_PM06G22740 [Panicum miliaceum]